MEIAEVVSSSELVRDFRAAVARERSLVIDARPQTQVADSFAHSVAAGLRKEPRRLDYRFLYDSRGSALYEKITEQPEYYPTRTEDAILDNHAGEISDFTGPVNLVELGSGSSTKTDHLLRAYDTPAQALCYVPVDVSKSALVQAGEEILERRPEIQVVAINGTYEDAIPLVPCVSPAMTVFLGSSIGNLDPAAAARFWKHVAAHIPAGDFFLLGVDLVKEANVLEAAYNDAAGITEAFTLNLFHRMNRELGTQIDVDAIQHVARYVPERKQIEIYARFCKSQAVCIDAREQPIRVEAGEEVLIEISRKFDLAHLVPYLHGYGFELCRVFSDERDWFGVLLLQRNGQQIAV